MTLLAIPAGCQMLRTEHWFWHPAGVRPLTVPEPGGGIAPLDPRLPSGIPPGCLWPTSPLFSVEQEKGCMPLLAIPAGCQMLRTEH